jgi:hypothetical protein
MCRFRCWVEVLHVCCGARHCFARSKLPLKVSESHKTRVPHVRASSVQRLALLLSQHMLQHTTTMPTREDGQN